MAVVRSGTGRIEVVGALDVDNIILIHACACSCVTYQARPAEPGVVSRFYDPSSVIGTTLRNQKPYALLLTTV